jgi:hypothetical protein
VCIFVLVQEFRRGRSWEDIWSGWAPIAFILGVLAVVCASITGWGIFEGTFGLRKFRKDMVEQIRAALENGNASVCSVESNRVIVIEEAKDDGVAFIYDLGDGTSLYLRSESCEYYTESITGEEEPWPARRFDIVRSAANDLLIGVLGADERLEPSQTIPMTDMPGSFEFAEEPKTETILPGSPEEILGHEPDD